MEVTALLSQFEELVSRDGSTAEDMSPKTAWTSFCELAREPAQHAGVPVGLDLLRCDLGNMGQGADRISAFLLERRIDAGYEDPAEVVLAIGFWFETRFGAPAAPLFGLWGRPANVTRGSEVPLDEFKRQVEATRWFDLLVRKRPPVLRRFLSLDDLRAEAS